MESKNNTTVPDSGKEIAGFKVPAMLCFTLAVVITELSIFIFVLRNARKKDTMKSKDRKRTSTCRFLAQLSPVKKFFLISNIVMIAYSTLLIVRLLLPIKYDDATCTVLLQITGPSMYSLCMVSVYLFLWARQYLIHRSPVLRAIMPGWLPLLSKVSLLLTIFACIAPLMCTWLAINGKKLVQAEYKDGICYHKASSLVALPILMVTLTVISQFSYLLMFYVTMRIHQRSREFANIVPRNRAGSFANLIRRCFWSALMCILSDMAAMILINTLGEFMPELYVHIFSKTDTLFNLLCTLFTFSSFSETLTCITCNHEGPDSDHGNSMKTFPLASSTSTRSIQKGYIAAGSSTPALDIVVEVEGEQ